MIALTTWITTILGLLLADVVLGDIGVSNRAGKAPTETWCGKTYKAG
jgi:hypothetical protein